MFVTLADYSTSANCVHETARRRLSGVACTHGAHGEHRYHLARAVQTLRPREIRVGAVERLARAATPTDDPLFVRSADALTMARELLTWLPPDAVERFRSMRGQFYAAVASSNLCAEPIVQNLADLADLFILQNSVLRHVLTGSEVTDIHHIAPAFALVNFTYSIEQEAA